MTAPGSTVPVLASRPTSAVRLYAEGLHAARAGRSAGLRVRDDRGGCGPFAVDDWHADRIPGDAGLLDRCTGPTLDVGCGPGRLAAALGRRGVPVLAVDVVPSAVACARRRGVAALRRSVFDRLPGEGRWHRVLLTDGNVGIGGDPVGLLRRCAALLHADGRLLVECAPGGGVRRTRVRLEDDARHSEWIDWARVGVDSVSGTALAAGLVRTQRWTEAGRWFVALAPA